MQTGDKAAPASVAGESPDLGARLGAMVLAVLCGSDERSRLRRDAASAFLVRATSAAILYLSQIVLARLMGGFEYGIYVFVWTWVLVLGGLSNLGFPVAMMRLLPSYRETGDEAALRGLLRFGRVLVLASSTLVALIAFATMKGLGQALPVHYFLPAVVALFCVPMVTLSELQDGIGRAHGWMVLALIPPYVLRPILVLAGMLAAHLAGWPMTAETAAGAAVIGCWITTVVQTVLLQRRLRAEVARGPNHYRPKTWMLTALPLLVIAFCELLLQNTDVIVVSQYLTAREAGLYYAAAKTMSLVLFIHYAVGSAMANRFSALDARGDRAALQGLVRDSVMWTFWPSLAATLVILLLGKPLLSLFGPEFTNAYPIMAVLAVGYLFRAAMGPSEFLLNMLGQQRACAAMAVLAASFNIGLSVLLVPRYGIIGAAAATASAYMLGALLNAILAYRRLGLTIAVWSTFIRP